MNGHPFFNSESGKERKHVFCYLLVTSHSIALNGLPNPGIGRSLVAISLRKDPPPEGVKVPTYRPGS